MLCGFDNINDLCCHKYSYQYASTISNGIRAVALDTATAPVYRIDTETNETILLTNTSSLTIDPCSANEEFDIISAWECYQIWLNACGNTPLDPPLGLYRTTQKSIIEQEYKTRIAQGYSSTLSNGYIVTLGLTAESQANIAMAVLSANLLYNSNPQSIIPPIYDISGQAISLSYEQLISLYKKYTSANTAILNLRSYLIAGIDASTSIEEVVSYVWDLGLIELAVACPDCYVLDPLGECVPYTGAPLAPSGLTASPLHSAAYLSWSAPKCNGGYDIIGHSVQYSTDYGQSWTNYLSILGPDLFGIITGLTNGTTYVFRIAALSPGGTGTYSFESSPIVVDGDMLYSKTRLLLSFD